MAPTPIRFSLVLATVGRTEELSRFLAALNAQTWRSFELIVVDQNPDGRLASLLEPFQAAFPIVRVHSAKGLSRARNVGLRHVRGDIVAFPDDDCWYPSDLLAQVAERFDRDSMIDGLTGRCEDGTGRPSVNRWLDRPTQISRLSVWRTAVSITLFLRRVWVEQVGPFEERLGAGSGTPWGSGEETDYIVRAVEKGARIMYSPDIVVFHPNPVQSFDALQIAKARAYGAGMGWVLWLHGYPPWFVAYSCLRPLGGVLLSAANLNLPKARLHWAVMTGRALGWWAARRSTRMRAED